jgi:maltooligosyltrehalose synthase
VIIAVVPRFANRLIRPDSAPAIASERLKTATLSLPPEWAQHHFRNVFTRETLAALPQSNGAAIPLIELFASCPVALLEAVGR